MIIDCHMHYEPGVLPAERMLAVMDRHGIDKVALIPAMVEPFTLHSRIKQLSLSLLRYGMLYFNAPGRFFYQALLIDKKGCFHALWDKYRVYDRIDNAEVAAVLEKYPDRFFGWIFINPAVDADPVQEVERWSALPGMVGVKAHPFWHRYEVEKLDPVAAWCREHDRPLLIHLGTGAGGDFRRLPEKYPGLKVIFAHAGVPYFSKIWTYIKDREGLYVDLSGLYLDRYLVRRAVDFLGAEKCMYGTDGPYGKQRPGEDYDYGWIKGWIESLPISDREHEMIFHANFEAVCGLG